MKQIFILFFYLISLFNMAGAQDSPKLSPALRTVLHQHLNQNISSYEKSFGLHKSAAGNYYLSLLVTKKDASFRPELNRYNGFGGADSGNMFIAYLPATSVDSFAENSNISFIDIAPRAAAKLDLSLATIQADLAHQGAYPLNMSFNGAGVVIGIIDSGIDFTHPVFKHGDGTTRISYLWDQTVAGPAPGGYNYGTEWTCSEIDASWCSEIDGPDHHGHGTHVAGIAGGSDHTSGTYQGVAPEAEIIFIKTDFDFGHIIDGIQYVFNRAGSKPAVVNLSLSTHQGPHDNTSSVSRMINQLTAPGKIIVAAASNEGNKNIHIHYQADNSTVKGTQFSAPDNDQDFIGLDLWYPPPGQISFAIAGLDANDNWISQTNWVEPGQRVTDLPFMNGQQTFGLITLDASETDNPFNHNRHVYIEINNDNKKYDFSKNMITWILLSKGNAEFDGWIFDNRSSFADFSGQNFNIMFEPGNSSSTIGIPGTATGVITVGAFCTKTNWSSADGHSYNVSGTPGDWAFFSSIGPTRDGRIKPDIAAPGLVIASALAKDAQILETYPARVLPGDQFWVLQGTSMAAPHVSGSVALLLQKKPDLTAAEILTILKETAETDNFTGQVPNPVWGSGKLNIFAALSSLMTSVPRDDKSIKPVSTELYQNYPNPYNPQSVGNMIIHISEAMKNDVKTLKILNVLGQEIAEVQSRPGSLSQHKQFYWDGKDRSGNFVSPGIYFYRIQSNPKPITKKFIIVY